MNHTDWDMQGDEIAIIGLAGRFPGAGNLDEFWQNLCQGVESIVSLTAEDLKTSGIDAAVLSDPNYVMAGAPLDEAEKFDAAFFGYHPREAALIDPQQRVFLECAYSALENAGYDPERYQGLIGVFGGVSRNAYLLNNIATHPELRQAVDDYHITVSSEADFAATRVSYKLNLTGPAFTVRSACSTSGVAIHLASQSLISGDCDMALAGGCRILVPTRAGYQYVEGGPLSPDGHCRAFDAQAKGMVRASGAALVVLKRLEAAVQDGDHIYAVIKSTAINNDGSAKIGFTAPSVRGQSTVIAEALALAGVSADSITYVEAHGTGTTLGDPIEVSALTKAFRESTDRKVYCALGSVKTNIGHLDAGAGAAGVIKTALALKHKVIPPSLHFESPNPEIDFANSPFFVNDRLRDWPAGDTPRRAGVNSLGLGGTNAHIVMEEFSSEPSGETRPYQLLLLSAKTESALETMTSNLAGYLQGNPDLNLGDVAYTLQLGRQHFSHRRVVVCQNPDDATAALTDPQRVKTRSDVVTGRPVTFMFPGGGAQYVNMARDLYQEEPVFRQWVDECATLLMPRLDLDIRTLLYASDEREEMAAQLERPSLALPALFTVEYALARLWQSWGVHPQAMIGHSMGEYTAACLAGVVSLADALALVTVRGHLFEELPKGAMISVPLSEAEASVHMSPELSFAAINKTDSCVVSGPTGAIETLQETLAAQSIHSTRIHISVAAHSQLVEPILDKFLTFLETIQFNAPEIPFVSNVTGNWITAEEAADPHYWVRHLRHTVRFADGLHTLLAESEQILLEVGPGRTLSTFARQHPAKASEQVVVASLRHPKEQISDVAFILGGLGQLWLAGYQIDWMQYYAHERRHRVPLPTYPFERERFWIEPQAVEIKNVSQSRRLSKQHEADKNVRESVSTIMNATTTKPSPASRKERISQKLKEVIHDLSGISADDLDVHTTFLELGFDSLFLTQANTTFRKTFGVKLSFRQLFEDAPTIDALSAYIDSQLPPDAFPAQDVPTPSDEVTPSLDGTLDTVAEQLLADASGSESAVEKLVHHQLQVMAQQLALLRGLEGKELTLPPTPQTAVPQTAVPSSPDKESAPQNEQKGHGPWKPVQKRADGLTPHQKKHLDALIARYTERTKGSKAWTEGQRPHLADPRAITGFRKEWKEMVYQIAVERSSGSKVWDVDGNEYIDFVMSFGIGLFGHSPEFVKEAVAEQLSQGFELGVLSPLAREVADLVCDITGQERAVFVNTGSEAVSAAIRAARTTTGRDRIAVFEGDYHGISDEVLVRGITLGGKRVSMPVAPGIPDFLVENVLVLDYDDPQCLDIIEANADDLAAVIVEPVPARDPGFQPKEVLQRVRQVTAANGIALIFDEMITGFRLHPRGAQGWYGIDADIGAYGKILSGGLPMAVVAGKAEFMDAFDGGPWQFGDDSFPEKGVTFFGGTFVRHPLSLAASRALLQRLQQSGPELYDDLNAKTDRFVKQLQDLFVRTQAPLKVTHCGSMFHVLLTDTNNPLARLIFFALREKGVHITERASFLSTEHTEADLDFVLQAFAQSIQEMQEADFFSPSVVDGPPPADPNQVREIPLTDAQQEIWLATHLDEDASSSYNLSQLLNLRGELDIEKMRRAIQKLVDRHEALRVTIDPEQSRQHIHPSLTIDVPFIDLSKLSKKKREDEMAALQEAEVQTSFDLTAGPLFRAEIVRLTKQTHCVILTAHHIICDGWSFGVLLQELSQLYTAACENRAPNLETPPQLSQYVQTQTAGQNGHNAAETEAFWLEQFAGSVPILELPTDRLRPPVKTYHASQVAAVLDATLSQQLQQVAVKEKSTHFTLLLAAFTAYLQRLTGQTDIVVGIAAAGQLISGMTSLVGHCVHALPVRSQVEAQKEFVAHLHSMRGSLADIFEYQNFTVGELIKKLNLPRDPSRLPIMSVVFNMDTSMGELVFDGLSVDSHPNPRRYEHFELFINVARRANGLALECTYNTDLFDAETIARRLAEFETFLAGIVADPHQRIAEVPLLSHEERERLLVTWNDTAVELPPSDFIHELFAAQAEHTPQAKAVKYGQQTINYHELNRRANQVAHYLQGLGVGPETIVGIYLDRSIDMVVGLLGVLKAGGAYMPLDTTWPEKRLAFMLADARVPVILTHERLVQSMPLHEAEIVKLDGDWPAIAECAEENPISNLTADNIAYLIYTSGSTGQPKGVPVPHRGIPNLAQAQQETFAIHADSRVLQFAAFGFDASVSEIFTTLTAGATLILADYDDLMPGHDLSYLMLKEEVTVATLPPSALAILSPDDFPTLQTVVAAGEACTADIVARWAPGHRFVNGYGPTEATVCAAMARLEDGQRSPPIGRPVDNAQLYVLNTHMQPVPVGVPGELYVAGVGLARGYWERAGLTAEKFVPNPFPHLSSPPMGGIEGGKRLYKTGDLVKYLPDGNIEFLGRSDRQAKIRGYRIELGEIEAALRQHTAVKEAVVSVYTGDSGEKQLVAYLIGPEEIDHNMLVDYLSETLPTYMIPASFMFLDAFPLTPSGKIDRKALPTPKRSLTGAYVAPRNAVETVLANLWSEVLKVEQIGIYDNFFNLGGHSLLGTQLISRIRATLRVQLSLRMLFRGPTIAELAKAVLQPPNDSTRITKIAQFLVELSQLSDEEAAALLEKRTTATKDALLVNRRS